MHTLEKQAGADEAPKDVPSDKEVLQRAQGIGRLLKIPDADLQDWELRMKSILERPTVLTGKTVDQIEKDDKLKRLHDRHEQAWLLLHGLRNLQDKVEKDMRFLEREVKDWDQLRETALRAFAEYLFLLQNFDQKPHLTRSSGLPEYLARYVSFGQKERLALQVTEPIFAWQYDVAKRVGIPERPKEIQRHAHEVMTHWVGGNVKLRALVSCMQEGDQPRQDDPPYRDLLKRTGVPDPGIDEMKGAKMVVGYVAKHMERIRKASLLVKGKNHDDLTLGEALELCFDPEIFHVAGDVAQHLRKFIRDGSVDIAGAVQESAKKMKLKRETLIVPFSRLKAAEEGKSDVKQLQRDTEDAATHAETLGADVSVKNFLGNPLSNLRDVPRQMLREICQEACAEGTVTLLLRAALVSPEQQKSDSDVQQCEKALRDLFSEQKISVKEAMEIWYLTRQERRASPMVIVKTVQILHRHQKSDEARRFYMTYLKNAQDAVDPRVIEQWDPAKDLQIDEPTATEMKNIARYLSDEGWEEAEAKVKGLLDFLRFFPKIFLFLKSPQIIIGTVSTSLVLYRLRIALLWRKLDSFASGKFTRPPSISEKQWDLARRLVREVLNKRSAAPFRLPFFEVTRGSMLRGARDVSRAAEARRGLLGRVLGRDPPDVPSSYAGGMRRAGYGARAVATELEGLSLSPEELKQALVKGGYTPAEAEAALSRTAAPEAGPRSVSPRVRAALDSLEKFHSTPLGRELQRSFAEAAEEARGMRSGDSRLRQDPRFPAQYAEAVRRENLTRARYAEALLGKPEALVKNGRLTGQGMRFLAAHEIGGVIKKQRLLEALLQEMDIAKEARVLRIRELMHSGAAGDIAKAARRLAEAARAGKGFDEALDAARAAGFLELNPAEMASVKGSTMAKDMVRGAAETGDIAEMSRVVRMLRRAQGFLSGGLKGILNTVGPAADVFGLLMALTDFIENEGKIRATDNPALKDLYRGAQAFNVVEGGVTATGLIIYGAAVAKFTGATGSMVVVLSAAAGSVTLPAAAIAMLAGSLYHRSLTEAAEEFLKEEKDWAKLTPGQLRKELERLSSGKPTVSEMAVTGTKFENDIRKYFQDGESFRKWEKEEQLTRFEKSKQAKLYKICRAYVVKTSSLPERPGEKREEYRLRFDRFIIDQLLFLSLVSGGTFSVPLSSVFMDAKRYAELCAQSRDLKSSEKTTYLSVPVGGRFEKVDLGTFRDLTFRSSEKPSQEAVLRAYEQERRAETVIGLELHRLRSPLTKERIHGLHREIQLSLLYEFAPSLDRLEGWIQKTDFRGLGITGAEAEAKAFARFTVYELLREVLRDEALSLFARSPMTVDDHRKALQNVQAALLLPDMQALHDRGKGRGFSYPKDVQRSELFTSLPYVSGMLHPCPLGSEAFLKAFVPPRSPEFPSVRALPFSAEDEALRDLQENPERLKLIQLLSGDLAASRERLLAGHPSASAQAREEGALRLLQDMERERALRSRFERELTELQGRTESPLYRHTADAQKALSASRSGQTLRPLTVVPDAFRDLPLPPVILTRGIEDTRDQEALERFLRYLYTIDDGGGPLSSENVSAITVEKAVSAGKETYLASIAYVDLDAPQARPLLVVQGAERLEDGTLGFGEAITTFPPASDPILTILRDVFAKREAPQRKLFERKRDQKVEELRKRDDHAAAFQKPGQWMPLGNIPVGQESPGHFTHVAFDREANIFLYLRDPNALKKTRDPSQPDLTSHMGYGLAFGASGEKRRERGWEQRMREQVRRSLAFPALTHEGFLDARGSVLKLFLPFAKDQTGPGWEQLGEMVGNDLPGLVQDQAQLQNFLRDFQAYLQRRHLSQPQKGSFTGIDAMSAYSEFRNDWKKQGQK